MVKTNIFEITLNRFYASYVPGETVDGYVTLEILEEVKCRGIHFEASGKEKVKIVEGSGQHRTTHTRQSIPFEYKIPLYTPQDSTVPLPPNRYTYPFRFTIPHGVKSSFEGDHGHVRYKVKCHVDVPMAIDPETEKYITITQPVDLKCLHLDSREPTQKEESATFCCWCCKTDRVTASFQIDKGTYVCGEGVKVVGSINNPTNRTLKASIGFTQKVKYRIKDHKEDDSEELVSDTLPKILAGQTLDVDTMLQVPPCLPQHPGYTMDHAVVSYQVEVFIYPLPACTGLPMVLDFPVVIGTMPEPGSFNLYVPKDVEGGATTQQPVPMGTMDSGQIPPVSLVPHNFFKQEYRRQKKIRQGKENELEPHEREPKPFDQDSDEFKPAYPFYSWDNIYFTWGREAPPSGEGVNEPGQILSQPVPMYPTMPVDPNMGQPPAYPVDPSMQPADPNQPAQMIYPTLAPGDLPDQGPLGGVAEGAPPGIWDQNATVLTSKA